eukprot:sb/3468566/
MHKLPTRYPGMNNELKMEDLQPSTSSGTPGQSGILPGTHIQNLDGTAMPPYHHHQRQSMVSDHFPDPLTPSPDGRFAKPIGSDVMDQFVFPSDYNTAFANYDNSCHAYYHGPQPTVPFPSPAPSQSAFTFEPVSDITMPGHQTQQHPTAQQQGYEPPIKKPRSKSSAKKSGSGKGDEQKRITDIKTCLLDHHKVGSEEIWRSGCEPRKKHKASQTTYKYPIQLSSEEEFTSLAILLHIFSKEATVNSGKWYRSGG